MALTLTERVAEIFRAKPNIWINAHEFIKAGGFAGFTARIRDLRKPPYGWVIKNRTYRVERLWGTETVSEYRYIPSEDANAKAS